MFFEQEHASGSVAGDLGIRRHMRIRRGMEDADGRAAPDRRAFVGLQQIVRILAAPIGQACTRPKSGIKAKAFDDLGTIKLHAGPALRKQGGGGELSLDIARRRCLRRGRPEAQHGAGLRMATEGSHDLFQRVRRIPAVVIGKSQDLLTRDQGEQMVSRRRYAARRQQDTGQRQGGMARQHAVQHAGRVLVCQIDVETGVGLSLQRDQQPVQFRDAPDGGDAKGKAGGGGHSQHPKGL